ncbi:WD repeat-containing protein 44 isoform X2 [Kryptolebias marmoratus]|uniref:WD repeat-containing protein 44 n=1 Tax=Kryptolebias marmoratus TaxID=37003 RepID=A0A3Q3A951_KRYMA|nr:WD repeat-containing protein 44 isoform X2 [Kryptolebias marmoratus]
MASDTSDTEEFYDAPEDVNFTPSPKVSPMKFVIPSPQILQSSDTVQDVSCAASESQQDDSLQIIDSIIEESQKGIVEDVGEVAQLLDELHVDVRAEAKEEQNAEEVPVERPVPADGPELVEGQEQEKSVATNGACSLPDPEPSELPGPSVASQERVQPPDITSTIGQSQPDEAAVAAAEGEKEQRPADILDQVPLTDRPADSDSQGPMKPPRQFTVEPDIVASTKKPPPSRPPPPVGGPPPRPPPPAKNSLSSKKSQETLRPSGLEVSSVSCDSLDPSGLVSPCSTVRSLTKELQHSLDLASATSGDKVVTAQENEDEQASSQSGGQTPGPQRPRSNSGRELTDEEILASVMIKNLDTGEEIPLIQAEEKLPAGINPLTLHIMRRTKEYITNDAAQSDDDDKPQAALSDTDGGKLKQKTTQLKKFLGKSVKKAKHLAEEYGEKAVNKVKSVRDEVKMFHTDQDDPSSSDDEGMPYTRPVKFKAAHSFKGPFDFDQIKVVQDLSGEHMGAVWTMKFSHCGRLLATAGQDNIVRIWVLKTAFDYFNNMRIKYNTEGRVSPSPSQESLCSSKSDTDPGTSCIPEDPDTEDRNAPFRQVPFCKYKGHTADLLDLSWSKNFFLLSSSMDKTVRLWHISRRECLCCFQHIDFVTAIAFHPRDDRYFLSGSLDGKLRLWNIPDKKVALWNEVDGQTRLITAANFCQNGKYAVIGTYDGRCIFYDTERLKYHTQIHVRSTRGRNKVGRKITGIEPLPGENKILVTSNDSRIRLYDLRDLSLSMKYKGYVNSSSQIKASFSHDYSFIVSGSEDKYVYIWSTYHDLSKFTSVRRDRNDFWEGIKAHNAVVTSAIFAPHPGLIVPQETGAEKPEADRKSLDSTDSETIPSGALKTDHTEVLLSADFTGAIKVFINVKKY